MFAFKALLLAVNIGAALCAPTARLVKRDGIDGQCSRIVKFTFVAHPFLLSDTVVLNFALTLEHLEAAFYTEGLKKLDAKAFAKAGYPPWVRNRFEQIREHEVSHVQLLQGALGTAATAACDYSL